MHTPSRRRTDAVHKGADGHLLDRLSALLRYKYVALATVCVIVTGAGIFTYTQTPLYRASVRLLIELEDERSLAMEGVSGGTSGTTEYAADPEPYFQTQYRILTGRELARRSVRALKLTQVLEFARPGSGASWFSRSRERVKNIGRAALGRPTRDVTNDAGMPSEEAIIGAFASRVSVEPVRASRLVDVHFVSTDASLAARAANALADNYVSQNLQLRQQSMAKSLEWISEELGRQRTVVEASERAMAEYRANQNAMPLESPQNIVVARLNQLNDAATRARTVRAQKESLYKQVEALGPVAAADTIPAISQNPYIQSVKTRLADLQRQRTLLAERYGDRHPEMVTMNATIQDVTRELEQEFGKALQSIRHDYESAVLEEQTLASALDDQRAVATDIDRKSVNYTVLERGAESNRELYESLLQREKELQVMANSRGNNVRLVERAGVPTAPFSPNARRSLLLSSIAGLLAAFGLVLVLDYADDTIRTADDITRKLALPCLGVVPAAPGGPGRPILTASTSGPFGEAIRALRTSVAFSHAAPGTAVVAVTSAQPLEGKTTTACNLAAALSYGGARVLLIDADMRRPSLHQAFGIENVRGLSDLLSGTAAINQVVQRLADPNLWIMPAGSVPPNPSELLGSDRMEALLAQLRAGPFEWVIIDTPPVLPVTDTSVLARQVSGVVFVLGSGMTRRRFADRAIDTLASGRANILGAVLNRAENIDREYGYADYHATPAPRRARA
jgi:succinoglycan biosynthesis transport protein ExoP